MLDRRSVLQLLIHMSGSPSRAQFIKYSKLIYDKVRLVVLKPTSSDFSREEII